MLCMWAEGICRVIHRVHVGHMCTTQDRLVLRRIMSEKGCLSYVVHCASPWRPRASCPLACKALLLAGVLPELVAGREWRDPTRAGAVIACLQAILALQDGVACQAGPTLSGEPGMANRIKKLVKRAAGQPVRVSGLAERLGTSQRALRRIFRTETGMRLKDWIDDERARRIETLLAQGLTVAEIASRLGFSQPSDCGRLFRRVRGISPLQWRARSEPASLDPHRR